MPKRKISRSVKKFIRKEKARIRREFSDLEKRKEEIGNLYKKFLSKIITN